MNEEGYGETWDYRVLSWINTNPDEMPGRRVLTICRVYYRQRPVEWPNPDDGDVVGIESEIGLYAYTSEGLMLEVSRMQAAFDKPALIRAEWLPLILRRGVRLIPCEEKEEETE